MRNALILRANGDIEPASLPEDDALNGLTEMQRIVGGYIQHLPIPDATISVFVNEDGQGLKLPFNESANRLWGRYVNSPLLGDILVLGPAVGEETTELTGEKSAEIVNLVLAL